MTPRTSSFYCSYFSEQLRPQRFNLLLTQLKKRQNQDADQGRFALEHELGDHISCRNNFSLTFSHYPAAQVGFSDTQARQVPHNDTIVAHTMACNYYLCTCPPSFWGPLKMAVSSSSHGYFVATWNLLICSWSALDLTSLEPNRNVLHGGQEEAQ